LINYKDKMSKSKIFVMGDIHGRIEALTQCLERSNFDYDNDKLILLGDISDGGYNTYQVIEELLKIKNVIFIIGNHDEWFMNHIRSGWSEEIWIQQGGANTLRSYGAEVKESDKITDESFLNTANLKIPVTHQYFLNNGKYYHIENNILFVHGGITPSIPIKEQEKCILLWDREIINIAKYYEKTKKKFNYKMIFIGHTTTQLIMKDKNFTKPVKFSNLWCLDTGAGWNGKLTIMNIKTEKYWQSDLQIPAIRN